MSDLLRHYAAGFVARHAAQAAPQVQSVLAKLALCRTAALGGRVYECPQCRERCPLYNSCLDRHCPQCRGGCRADWVDRAAELLLPGITYFQVVFTVPEELSALMLGNRRATYGLLFRAAWSALREALHEEVGCEAAAWLVLHTWNQRLEHHPHVHALVPGGGPALQSARWVTSRHPTQQRRTQPYLVDYRKLSARFRDAFLTGLQRLHERGQLALAEDWAHLRDPAAFDAWLQNFRDRAWVVYIEPPPTAAARPENVLKYLARYLTGGPLSDRRLLAHQAGQVTFAARSKDKRSGNPVEPYTLAGIEFVRRWALHILPKGFVKSRGFGGYSGRHRQRYLRRCRELWAAEQTEAEPPVAPREESPPAELPAHRCPRCQTPQACVEQVERPSWRDVFCGGTRPTWYEPYGRRAGQFARAAPREGPDG